MAQGENLGASFTIDITDLKAGITQANRLIKESESEFKAAAAGLDKWSESEDGLNAKIKSLTDVTALQQKKVDALNEEYQRLVADGLDPATKQAVELRTKINNEQAALNKNKAELEKQTQALEDLQNASEDAGEAVEDTGKAAEQSGEGFTIAKGAIANLVATGLTALVEGCKNAVSSLMNLSEETQEYREDIGKLKSAFESAGKSTELATKTYKDFYSVLGEEDRSVEAVNHLAKFVETEEDMAKWTDICTGVWATFGDSLPIEGLTEAANESIKVGKSTSVLNDALVWAGISEDAFNESLAACTTEQERAALITETLNGLYSTAADNYRENNASIIEARKATSDYTDAMANLGEKMEPTRQAINELKNELIKGLTPAIEKEVIPSINEFFTDLKKDGTVKKFSDNISNLAKKVLPVVSSALKFLAENLETIVKVGFTAVTVFAAFNAALKISTAIKAAQTAMAGLSAATSVATAAQTGLNAAMAANPIGAVATAIALLTVSIITLATKEREAADATDIMSESHREAVTAAQEAAEAFEATKKSATELASAELANVDYTQSLWQELQTLTDENGNVQEGYEARAQFILNELNGALGTEYEMNGNLIERYGEIKDSIYEVINAKKAQILLEAYEQSYKDALIEVANAEQRRGIEAQGLAAAQKEVAAAQAEVTAAQDALDDATSRGSEFTLGYASALSQAQEKLREKTAVLKEQETAYDESETAIGNYYSIITDYEQASTLALQGETEKAINILSNYGNGFKTAASTAQLSAAEQKKVLEQQVIDTEVSLKLMEEDYAKRSKNMTDEEKKQAELRIENARQQAKDAKVEFQKVGGDITKGIADGSEGESWILNNSMTNLINNALAAARRASDSHSPSRLFRKKVGLTIGQGVAVGIDDGTKDVVKSVRNQIATIQDEYNLDGIATDINAGVTARNNGSGSVGTDSNNGSVVVYQTNNYSQQHSRYELYKSQQQTAAAVRLALGV